MTSLPGYSSDNKKFLAIYPISYALKLFWKKKKKEELNGKKENKKKRIYSCVLSDLAYECKRGYLFKARLS